MLTASDPDWGNSVQIRGTVRPEGSHHMRPRGSIVLTEPRDRLAGRPLHAAYEVSGRIDRHSIRWVGTPGQGNSLPLEFPELEVVEECSEEVAWGGLLLNHYGHFLVESVGRLWPLVTGGPLHGRPVVFGGRQEPATRVAAEWLEAFGVESITLPEQGAMRFARMLVPELAWRLNVWCCPEIRDLHLHARQGIDIDPPNPSDGVVWLSRSRLASRAPYDERLLEWLLGERITVVNPECLSLADQVAALESARAITGVIGSGFHTLLLTERTPDCLYLCPEIVKAGFPVQHRLLGGNAVFAVDTLEVTPSTRRAGNPWVVFPAGYRLDVPETLRVMDATVLPGLLDDPRLAAFGDLSRHRVGTYRHLASELDAAAQRMLCDPDSIGARKELAAAFEAEGLDDCAEEQLQAAADLAGEL